MHNSFILQGVGGRTTTYRGHSHRTTWGNVLHVTIMVYNLTISYGYI